MITKGTVTLEPGFGSLIITIPAGRRLLFVNASFGASAWPGCGPEPVDYFRIQARRTQFRIKYHIESGTRDLKYYYISI